MTVEPLEWKENQIVIGPLNTLSIVLEANLYFCRRFPHRADLYIERYLRTPVLNSIHDQVSKYVGKLHRFAHDMRQGLFRNLTSNLCDTVAQLVDRPFDHRVQINLRMA